MPARNVVIVGTTRGLNGVDELDIIQMAGRAGRYLIDVEGDCYLITNDPNHWASQIKNPRPILSMLQDKDVLGFHILCEIQSGNVRDEASLYRWFDRTLAKVQGDIQKPLVSEVLVKLISWGMLAKNAYGRFLITPLGGVAAQYYFYPQDVYAWNLNFSCVAEKNQWDSDLSLAYAFGSIPKYDLGYLPKDLGEEFKDFIVKIESSKVFSKMYRSAAPFWFYNLLQGMGVSPGIRSTQMDAERISEALQEISRINQWGAEDKLEMLCLRVKYGVRQELAEFCRIPGVGPVRAEKLYARGLRSVEDVGKKEFRKAVESAVGKNLYLKISSSSMLITSKAKFEGV